MKKCESALNQLGIIIEDYRESKAIDRKQTQKKIYIPNWDKVKAGVICYGSKGQPLEYVDRDGDRIKLVTLSGKVSTDISNIKLIQHEHYRSFRWTTPPGARIASAAANGIGYHPNQLIAIGEWYNPVQEKNDDGSIWVG